MMVAWDVVQAMWDENKTGLMWVVIKSDRETEGEYAARLWFTDDGTNPQDWRNENRRLAQLDPAEMDGAPKDADVTTTITGLRANQCAFGFPWSAEAQDVKQNAQLNLFVECCEELTDGTKLQQLPPPIDSHASMEPVASLFPQPHNEESPTAQLASVLCEDPWHDTDVPLSPACPMCGYSYEDDLTL